jgi:hypothetical protein
LRNETATWARRWTAKEAKHVEILESNIDTESFTRPGVVLSSTDPDHDQTIAVGLAYKELRYDQRLLLDVLDETGRNLKRAAEILGIHPITFRRRLRQIQHIFVRHAVASEARSTTSDDCRQRLSYPQALEESSGAEGTAHSKPIPRLLRLQMPLPVTQSDRFVRVPTDVLNAILRSPIMTGTQLRILLWVMRQTYGWNRKAAMFSWYGIAQDLSMDRGGIVRAGNALLRSKVLHAEEGRVRLHPNYVHFTNSQDGCRSKSDDRGHPRITRQKQAVERGTSMTRIIGTDDVSHRFPVKRKTGVKTELQRRRRHAYVDNPSAAENNAVQELLNVYGALKGKALSPEEITRYSDSAQALLEACSNNLQEAKALLSQSFAKPRT